MQLRKLLLRLLAALVIAGVSGTTMVLTASYLYLAPQLPPAAELRQVEFQIPLRVYTRDGRLIGEYGEQRRTPVSFDDLPETFIQAVLSAEDERFFRHNGVDVRGLIRAALELARYREIRSGGSTITMQVARNFFLSRDQTFLRKFNEIVLALQIENVLSKEEILELYLNKIFLGYRSYGAEAAAQVYYGTSIDQLELAQWAMIAGLPKAPSSYNPIANPNRALARRNWILRRMHRAGHISREQYQQARAQTITARLHGSRPETEGAYLADLVRQEVLSQYGERTYTEGLRVYTTLDSKMQDAAVLSLRNGLHDYDERHGWRGAEASIDVSELPALSGRLPEAEAPEEDVPVEATDESPAPQTDIVSSEAAAWAEKLRPYRRIAQLEPALVAEIDEHNAHLVLANGELVILPMSAMQWAHPYIDANTRGRAPEQPADILNIGDVVRLRPVSTEDGPHWRLAQLPTAQSSVIAIDPRNGAIRAMQGGYSFNQSQFNRASEGTRQTGSVFKPFIYAAGLEHGMTPATVINDAPIVFEDAQLEATWRPTGASSRFYGPTRLREALYRSLNLVSVRLLRDVGINNTVRTMNQLGLPTERFSRDLALALGSAAMTPLEVATGYAVFANRGFVVEPWMIERIDNNNHETLWRAPGVVLCNEECEQARAEQALADMTSIEAETETETEQAESEEELPGNGVRWIPRSLDERTAWLMDSMLRDVITRGTGTRARQLNRHDLAGKTGSTNDHLDAWFAGYSPALVSVVWVGFDSPTSLGRGEYGGRTALPVWVDFMADALDGLPEISLPQPPGITSVRINPDNGLRARSGDPRAVFEYFRSDNLPEMDDQSPSSGNDDEQDSLTPEELF